MVCDWSSQNVDKQPKKPGTKEVLVHVRPQSQFPQKPLDLSWHKLHMAVSLVNTVGDCAPPCLSFMNAKIMSIPNTRDWSPVEEDMINQIIWYIHE